MFTRQCTTNPLLAGGVPKLAVLALLFAAVGCDSKSAASPEKAEAKKDGPAPSAEKPGDPEPVAKAEEAKPAPELAEYVLDSGGPEWVGWVATAPAGCKVMADLSQRVRIACGRRPKFDLVFDQGKVDFEARKKNLSDANAKTPETVRTVTKDEADALAWSSENKQHKFTTLSFLDRSTVEGVVITCGNLPTKGLADEVSVELHKRACASLAKKK